jgi:DsbC/DsbD-like thiol-disulfide interchange protein
MTMTNFQTTIIAILAFCISAVSQVHAASTDWQELGGGKARLAAVLDPATNEISAMVEIRLDEGWKTYWREPGGSGMPPQFDFSGSRHFLPGEVEFPVPRRLEAGGTVFAGYKGDVRFPFRGKLAETNRDGLIKLDLLAGVCEEICIPATAQFEIGFSELFASDFKAETEINDAFDKVPREPGDDFRVVRAKQLNEKELRIDVRIPDDASEAELFAEGPAGWYLTPADPVSFSDGMAEFSLDLSNIPDGADPAATKLRYTVAVGDRGIEQWVQADK